MKKKSAIIPYRKNGDKIELLLIRNYTNTKWVIPKGTIEAPLNPHISATKEAYEEAGVLGRPHPIIVGTYYKNHQKVPAYLLKVDLDLEIYEEKNERAKKWVVWNQIASYVYEEDLYQLLQTAVMCINKVGTYFKYAVKTFCKINNYPIIKLGKKKTIIKYSCNVTGSQPIYIHRRKNILEFIACSRTGFNELTEIPQELATTFLQENSKNTIGFWSINRKDGQYVFSRVYNTPLKMLNSKYFEAIVRTLADRCHSVEQDFQKRIQMPTTNIFELEKQIPIIDNSKDKLPDSKGDSDSKNSFSSY